MVLERESRRLRRSIDRPSDASVARAPVYYYHYQWLVRTALLLLYAAVAWDLSSSTCVQGASSTCMWSMQCMVVRALHMQHRQGTGPSIRLHGGICSDQARCMLTLHGGLTTGRYVGITLLHIFSITWTWNWVWMMSLATAPDAWCPCTLISAQGSIRSLAQVRHEQGESISRLLGSDGDVFTTAHHPDDGHNALVLTVSSLSWNCLRNCSTARAKRGRHVQRCRSVSRFVTPGATCPAAAQFYPARLGSAALTLKSK